MNASRAWSDSAVTAVHPDLTLTFRPLADVVGASVGDLLSSAAGRPSLDDSGRSATADAAKRAGLHAPAPEEHGSENARGGTADAVAIPMNQPNPALQTELLALDRALWSGGEEAYRENLDERCLLAFERMAGVSSREEVTATVASAPRWQKVDIEAEGLVQPTDDVAIITYRAAAEREGSEQYRARVSSGYVKRDGAWRMVEHVITALFRGGVPVLEPPSITRALRGGPGT